VLDALGERFPEFAQQRHPVHLAARDGIELVLELGGELVVDHVAEVFGQKAVDHAAHVGGFEAALLELDVFSGTQRRDDAGVGRRAPDAVLLERLDQARLGKARRRLGEVLGGVDRGEFDLLAFLQRRQATVVVLVGGLIVLVLAVGGDKAGELQGRAGRAEAVLLTGGQIHGDLVEDRRVHLRGQRALEDHLVETELVAVEKRAHLVRRVGNRGRADRLVGLLRVLRLGAVLVGGLRHVVGAVALADMVADFADGVVRQVDRVGTHVGDQTHGALADVDALVEILGGAHGARGGQPELAYPFLLHGGGGERRRGVALALAAVDLGDGELAIGGRLETFPRRGGAGLVLEGELRDLLAVELIEARGERLVVGATVGGNRPVFARVEGFDLLLALDDHPQGRALHAAGRQARVDLLPQQWREIEAHQVVERPACLLGVDQVLGQPAWLGDGLLHGTLGDLVEHHALGLAPF